MAATVPPAGALELIVGPMFSGKSTELLRRVRRHRFARRSTLVVKYSVSDGVRAGCRYHPHMRAPLQKDVRYSEHCVSTHDKVMESSVSVTALKELGDSWRSVDVRCDSGVLERAQIPHPAPTFPAGHCH